MTMIFKVVFKGVRGKPRQDAFGSVEYFSCAKCNPAKKLKSAIDNKQL